MPACEFHQALKDQQLRFFIVMKRLVLSITLLIIAISCNSQSKTIPRDTTFTLWSAHQKIKNTYPVAIPVRGNLPDGIEQYRDIVYTTLHDTTYGKRDLHLDLFRPEGKKKLPALIMIHGGGWTSGNKKMEIPMARQIATYGYVTIPIEYQLSPEAKYPAAVHNIKAAIRWTRANASRYHIDINNIAVSGTSAGGHLAALVGLTNGDPKFEGQQGNTRESSSVQAILVIDGLISFLAPLSLNKEREPESVDIQWLGGSYSEKPEAWKEASPIFHANPDAPPMLFINSGIPRFHAGQDELIGMLKRWNIYYEVHTIPVKVHPFWLFHPWFKPTVEYMTNFLEITLK